MGAAACNLKDWIAGQGGVRSFSFPRRVKLFLRLVLAVEACHLGGRSCGLVSPERVRFDSPDASGESAGLELSSQPIACGGRLDGDTLPQSSGEVLLEEELEYRAPECGGAFVPSPSADLYALGRIGQRLFSAGFQEALPENWDREVPDKRLVRLLRRCASWQVSSRPARLQEVIAELEEIQRSCEPGGFTMVSMPEGEGTDRSWKRILVPCVLLTLAGWLLLVSPLGETFAYQSYALLFPFRPTAEDLETTLLYMDDYSHRELAQPWDAPWSRRLHARLIHEMSRRGARAVVFDVLFDQPSQNPEEDRAFAEAAKAFGRVVVGARLTHQTLDGKDVGTAIEAPTEAIRSVTTWGLVELATVEGVAWLHLPGALGQPSLAQQTLRVAYPDRQIQDASRKWINFYGPPQRLPHFSYADALEPGRVPDAAFSNKVVFVGSLSEVGFSGGRIADEYTTPFTRWSQRKAPGVEVNATAYLNLARQDWLRPAELWIQMLLLMGVGFGLGMGAALLSRRVATAGVVGVVILTFACSVWAAWQSQICFPWLTVVGGQVPLAVLGMFAYRRQSRLKVPGMRLLRVIGKGTFGEVWLAQDAAREFKAVKIVHRRRFLGSRSYQAELESLERVAGLSRRCPHLVSPLHVADCADHQGYYYTMELTDDQSGGRCVSPSNYAPKTLASLLASPGTARSAASAHALSPAEWHHMALAIAEALDFLHRNELVHGDIKPANILFHHGKACLGDLGSVTQISQTSHSATRGTPAYAPPEGGGTRVADVFSYGRTFSQLWEACDRHPLGASWCAEVAKLLERATEENPDKRYQAGRELLAALRQLPIAG